MTGHTKEPWAYRPDANDDWGIIRAPITEQGQWLGGIICQARDPDRLGESDLAACRAAKVDPWEANARRIVDCVNALAGIPDPAAYVAAFEGMERALEKSREGWENADEMGIIPPQHRNTARILSDEAFTALTAARAARDEG